MSDQQKENALRIAAYLGNRLSPEEREAFKRALSEDDGLRLQYVDALMNRAESGPYRGGAGDSGGAGEVVSGAAGIGGTAEPDDGGIAGTGELEDIAREAYIGERENEARDNEMPEHGAEAREGEREGSEDVWTEGEEVRMGGRDSWEGVGEGKTEGGGEGVGNEETEGVGNEETEGVRNEEKGVAGEDEEAVGGEWAAGGERRRRGFLGSGWMVGAAALLLIIAGVVIFKSVRHQQFWDHTVASDSVSVRSQKRAEPVAAAAVADSGAAGKAAGAGVVATGVAATGGEDGVIAGTGMGVVGDSIYTRLYKPYMRGADPIVLRKYYRAYKAGNYSVILAEGDSVVSATPVQKLEIRDYMRLYKGLAQLATGNAREAVTELGGVVLRTKPGDDLYETARWYLALAWVKRNDVDAAEARGKALGLARGISRSYSRYKEPARQLAAALKL